MVQCLPPGGPDRAEPGHLLGGDGGPLHAQTVQGLHVPSGRIRTQDTDLTPLQVMEDGRPFLDMAHVITSLNRLDAGIPDKVTEMCMR